MKARLVSAVILVALLTMSLSITIGAAPPALQTPNSIEIGLLVDGSGSISAPNFILMKDAIAAAIEDPTCVPQDGVLNLTVIQFSRVARVELTPIQITAANVASVAQTIRDIDQYGDATNYEAGLNLAVATMPLIADYKAINIVTDGVPTVGIFDPFLLRAIPQDAGIDEMDAEGIAVGTGVTFLENLVFPQPASIHPPEPWPPAAPGWVRLVEDFNDLESSICEKFQVLIEPTPTPIPPTPTPIPPTPTPTPEPGEMGVPLDIHPTSCPNPINTKSGGLTSAALLGTADFDVTQIDPATIVLFNAGLQDPIEVSPLRWAFEDVATPFEPYLNKPLDIYACTEQGPDGYLDITLKFRTGELVTAMGEVNDGDALILTLTGNLLDGTPFVGEDVVKIVKKGR
ncbi:MAG: vWA domain-containing protein [Chloroflexota bacterium]|nr:vWA domain-containing protein [Chloroflexota bacterium]